MNFRNSFLIILILFIFSGTCSPQTIQDYTTYFAIGKSNLTQQEYIVLRKFEYQNKLKFFVVNPNNLSTSILQRDELNIRDNSWSEISKKFSNTPYIKALKESFENADTIQDAGITRFSSIEKGANLSVDLCPSSRPLDRNLFINLINDFGQLEKPVPIAISITGKWMQKHEPDLNWLKDLVLRNEVSIIWVNHSYNHRTSRTIPLKENFLLEKGTDINYEVLQTEIKMMDEGLVPSVFFRFPGLVSDKEIFKQINGFGLIPIGSDAWLGKNQWPKNGSIILLHANGNEPIGIERFFKLLNDEKNNIRKRQWLLYDLRESVEDFEDTVKIKN